MKNILMLMAVVAVASAGAFGLSYAVNREPELHRAAGEGDAMSWLRAEFQLDELRFAAIKTVHDEYSVVCGEHCTAIMSARARKASAEELAALEKTCVEAMTGHFRKVAALMPPAQAKRYLATVMPRVESYDHAKAPNLQVKP